MSAPSQGNIQRVYGDSPQPVLVGENWKTQDGFGIEAPLPVGYPSPTPPGCIELKTYPKVRRAQIESKATGGQNGFWPLFSHIQKRQIAMTSPVEMDYHKMSLDGNGKI